MRRGADVELNGETHALAAGDTLVLPAGARALLPDGTDRGTPPWIA